MFIKQYVHITFVGTRLCNLANTRCMLIIYRYQMLLYMYMSLISVYLVLCIIGYTNANIGPWWMETRLNIPLAPIKPTGGARGVVVIVVGNGHGDTSSNPGRDWLHFT